MALFAGCMKNVLMLSVAVIALLSKVAAQVEPEATSFMQVEKALKFRAPNHPLAGHRSEFASKFERVEFSGAVPCYGPSKDEEFPGKDGFDPSWMKKVPDDLVASECKTMSNPQVACLENSFPTFKKMNQEKWELLSEAQNVKTLEGDVLGEKGAYVITGPKGEKYPVRQEKFEKLKVGKQTIGVCTAQDVEDNKCLAEGNEHGTMYPKPDVRFAVQIEGDFNVHPAWSDQFLVVDSKKGGEDGGAYLVQEGPDPGDYSPIDNTVFPESSMTREEMLKNPNEDCTKWRPNTDFSDDPLVEKAIQAAISAFVTAKQACSTSLTSALEAIDHDLNALGY